MRKIITFAVIAVLPLIAANTSFRASAQKDSVKRAADAVANRYIVVLDDDAVGRGISTPEVEAYGQYLAYAYGGGDVREIYSNALKGFSIEMGAKEAEAMTLDPNVRSVEEDGYISLSTDQYNAPWDLDRVDQRAMPMDTTYGSASTGAGVHIYIIDSGIRVTHQDFGGRANVVYDNINDGQNGNDCNGHGTHVAGIAGSSTYGVAKGAFLHAVRVMPCVGNGQISNLLAGIDWVTANHISPSVANISITAAGVSPALETGLSNSIASGVTYTVASGNNGQDACGFTPARTPNALTIGATTSDDSRATYSNFGSCTDLFAPGNGVTSLSNANDTDTRVMNGTSMASPMVAGVAALYLSAHPNASPATVGTAIKNVATSGIVTDPGTGTPNLFLYSRVTGATAAIRIKKVQQGSSVPVPNPTFSYSSTNLAAANFSLIDNTSYFDPNVSAASGPATVSVTEGMVNGWTLSSIACTQLVNGIPTPADATVALAQRTATIRATQGQEVTCTFTSVPLAPSAANVSVSGRVVDPNGFGVPRAQVNVTSLNGTVVSTLTNPFGYYAFHGLEGGESYVLSASSKRYQFNTRLISTDEDLADVDLIAF